MSPLFLFFTVFVLSGAALAETPVESSVRSLAREPGWLKLGHYRAKGGGWESEMDGEAFFIAPSGKKDPEAELLATWKAFREDTDRIPEDQSFLCRFPARRKWFERNAPAEAVTWPARHCERFEKWRLTVTGKSLSLVFSSFFLNNPSSMFGHTFLRVNKDVSKKDGQRHELLDYGINYAANPTTSNPVLYALWGLFGGFEGTFTIIPYYYKVREYNNSESRDLWDYQLSLSPDAVDLFVRHLWELGPTYANYWYATKNCSYHVLTLIEAAEPSVDLTSRLKKYVIPGDTLKVLMETPGLVTKVSYRPSIRAEFEARLAPLDSRERAELERLTSKQAIPGDFASLGEDSRRRILDASLDWMDYQKTLEVQKDGTPEFAFKARLLAARSHIEAVTPTLKIEPSPREFPHLSHGSRTVTLGAQGGTDEGRGLLLSYRFALHDLLDPVTGYPDSAQIIFFDTRALWSQDRNRFRLEQFNLFEVVTLTPWSEFTRPLSWRLRVGLERELSREAFDVLGAQVSGGAGWNVGFGERWASSLYLGLQGAVVHRVEGPAGLPSPRSYLAAGPLVTWRTLWTDRWSLRADLMALPEAARRGEWSPRGFVGTQWARDNQGGVRLGWRGNDKEGLWSAEAVLYY